MPSTSDSRARAARRRSLKERFAAFAARHGALCGATAALLVFACLAATFWFTVFSGLSSSADFIYSQF